MSDVKISLLSQELAEAPADNDLLVIVDTSTGATKKIRADKLLSGAVPGLTATPEEINTVCDGTTAKNNHTHEGMGMGDVVGPASATDNAVARYDLATGKLLQDSLMTVSDAGGPNIPSGQTYNINGSPHTHEGGPSADTIKSMYFGVTYHDATHVDINCAAGYNQASIASETLAKNESGTAFGLDVDGHQVYIFGGVGISGTLVGVLSTSLQTCKANGNWYTPEAYIAGNNLLVWFVGPNNTRLDLTSIGSDLFLDVLISFVTTP